jgi:hypothetical protein
MNSGIDILDTPAAAIKSASLWIILIPKPTALLPHRLDLTGRMPQSSDPLNKKV